MRTQTDLDNTTDRDESGPRAEVGTGRKTADNEDASGTAGASEAPPNARGTLLGRYVLLERIGAGGMGTVYAAYDPELDRRVALKLLRSDAGQTGRARLLREAQAMARITHPNVITVHDVGSYEHGVFLAMALVDGQDLRTWLRESKRPWPEILAAFIAAARGLSAAHAAGLVHRDFKPANVLRGHDGSIQVVDFGLARMTRGGASAPELPSGSTTSSESGQPQMTDATSQLSGGVDLTRTGATMGTPAYMAPEQHTRGEIEPRTDQFGFCVALYEALYGARPFRATTRVALLFAVGRGQVPAPPSDSQVPTRIHTVLRRGLRPSAEDRWPTMDALVSALEHDPARTRRRLAVVGGLGLALAGGAFAAGRAEISDVSLPCTGAAARLHGVWDATRRDTVQQAFANTKTPYATAASARVTRSLDTWTQAWQAEHTEACSATTIRGEQSEAVLDLRMSCLESQRGQVAAVVDVLEDADALVVERSHHAIDGLPQIADCTDPERLGMVMQLPDDAATREAAAKIDATLAKVHALETAGRYTLQFEASTDALERARALDFPPLLAEALAQQARAQLRTGDNKAALQLLHEAAVVATIARDDLLLAKVWTDLVRNIGVEQSRHEDAQLWARYAEAALRRSGNATGGRVELAFALGTVLWAADNNEEALVHLREALALEEVRRPNGTLVASILSTIGNVEVRRGEPQRALEVFIRARALLRRAHGEMHPELGIANNSIGVAHYYLNDLAAAAEDYQRSYDILLAALGPDHPDLLFTLGNIGNIRREQGRLPEALATMMRVQQLVDKAFPAVHREAGTTAHNIGEVLREMGRADEALAYYRKALEIREQVHGVEGRYVANTLTGLAETLLDLGRHQQARPLLERALNIREASETQPRHIARTRFALARALRDIPDAGDRVRKLVLAARDGLPKDNGYSQEAQRAAIEAFIKALDTPRIDVVSTTGTH